MKKTSEIFFFIENMKKVCMNTNKKMIGERNR